MAPAAAAAAVGASLPFAALAWFSASPSFTPLSIHCLQWEKYERKVTERSVEQQSALSRSTAGLLDSVRKRFAAPAPGAATPAMAAESMATPRAGLIAAVGGSGVPPTTGLASSAVGPTDTPRSSGAAFREDLGAELNRSLGGGSGTAPTASAAPAAPTTSFAAAAAAMSMAGLGSAAPGGGDSMLQQASNMFLQQVEDMRRKYMAEVDRLKVWGMGGMEAVAGCATGGACMLLGLALQCSR